MNVFKNKKASDNYIIYLVIGVIGFLIISNTSFDLNTLLKKQDNTTQPVQEYVENNIIIIPELESLKLSSWNLQIFGITKSENEDVMYTITNILKKSDIAFIQEIRNYDGIAWDRLCSRMDGYQCKISSRAGRTQSKEQYGVLYKEGIEILDWVDYNPDELDRWERPPLKVKFKKDEYEFIVYVIHTKPDNTVDEIMHLENITINVGNVIVLGDLNMDCDYYDVGKNNYFKEWYFLIEDYEDTTVNQNTRCAYDRIIVNDNAKQEIVADGIYTIGITEDVSDHYQVWANILPVER